MRVLVATDAWHPQVNGVVRTLTSLAEAARQFGVTVEFLTPEGFPSIGVPTYPGLRVALPNRRTIAERIVKAAPDAIHIATEGPIGYAARSFCLRHGLSFTTSYTTCFPEYIAERAPIPRALSYAVLRRFHAAAAVTMVSTPSLMSELTRRGFRNLGMWGRGVDTDKFRPDLAAALDLPRPIFVSMGRVAVEKNIDAFLSLDLPGTKVVIGEGPQEAELRQRYPAVTFLGLLKGRARGASRRRRRVRVPEQDRHLRRGAARGARLRRAGRGLPGDGSARRGRRPRRGRARQRSARGVPRRAQRVARSLPHLRADALVGSQRAAIHRACQPGGACALAATASRVRRPGGGKRMRA